MIYFSRYRQKKLSSKLSVDFEVAFVSYARFTVSYCCIGHYVGNYYVDIINRQFDRLFPQTNEIAWNTLHINITYLKASADVKILNFLEKSVWGDEAVDHEMDL